VEVETLAAEIQSGVQHRRGLPSSPRGRAEHDSAGGPPSSHSLPMRSDLQPVATGRNSLGLSSRFEASAFALLAAMRRRELSATLIRWPSAA
jgi:hypothetical protein